MANQAEIKAVITADDRASSVLRGFGNSVEHFGKVAAAGVLAAGAAVTAFGVASVKAFMESEDAIAQTNAVLKSTGGVAGVTAEQVDQLASSLQKVTKFSDEEIRSGENLLLTFTKIGKDIFPQATETMLDMSAALGQDLKSSAVQLGKALQDPVLGITALRRVGVNFSDAQKDVIQNLVDTGRAAEAQKLILQELQVEFGGSAKAAGQTFAGKLEILKNSFNDVQEAVGKAIVDALTPFAKQLSDFVATEKFQKWVAELTKWIAENLPKAIEYVTTTVIPALKNVIELTWPVVKTLFDWFAKLVSFLSQHEYVFWSIVGVLAAVKTALFLEGALAAFQGVMNGVKLAYAGTAAVIASPIVMPAIAVGAALVALWSVRDAAFEAWDAVRNAKNAAEGLRQSNEAVRRSLEAGLLSRDAGVRDRSMRALQGLGFRASGGPVMAGVPYTVGEQGRETFVPTQNGTIVDANRSKGLTSGAVINLNVNVGMYAGTEIEKRKMAQTLLDAMRDLAGGNNMTLAEMLR